MSKEMRLAVETIISGPRFRRALTAVVERELGAALAPMVGPALVRALEKEMPAEFMRGMLDIFAGQDLGRMAKRNGDKDREQMVAALAGGVSVADVAAAYGRSERQVWRLKRELVANAANAVN